ncbi:outer membrane lipoprotein SlyB [Povalibacter uvarum]|uniref:Outer membrane lipoprotein SlyB n=1 Tax=Povalibacter uvarum TaxID=732238 RepID=A0A841HPG4_9GAMM|nr:glycine zipper domain-containing protein [Povalibacter uvarum]MBB6095211.1 outer membrane lipoprotein SlyB [Povalibacter uvarum]
MTTFTKPSTAVALLTVLFVSGASAQQRQTGQSFAISYGIVDRIDMVKVGNDGQPTGVATGAVVGGLAGSYNSSHGHQVRDAAAGALAGALLTAAIKSHKNKDNMAHQYTVNLVGGGTISVVVEQGDIDKGDCVAVEQGPSANVRKVTPVHCTSASDPAVQTADVTVKQQEEAADCHTAKEAALKATTESQIDVAVKKVRIFCES